MKIIEWIILFKYIMVIFKLIVDSLYDSSGFIELLQ